MKSMASVQWTPPVTAIAQWSKCNVSTKWLRTQNGAVALTATESSEIPSECVPLTALWASRPARLSGGHLAPRKQLADMSWQYSLGPCLFLVALGRMPGITLCMWDNRARCPRVRDKNICRSHRVVGCLSSPTEKAREPTAKTFPGCVLSLWGTLRAPEPESKGQPTWQQMQKPLCQHLPADKGWGQRHIPSWLRLRWKTPGLYHF